jgi:hypothetical protein
MPRNTTSQALFEHWRRHIEDWRSSGLTQQAFCRDRDLSYHQFHYWRRKITQQPTQLPTRQPPTLVPVTYQPDSLSRGLSLQLPNGITLRGIAPENLTVVERLLEALR